MMQFGATGAQMGQGYQNGQLAKEAADNGNMKINYNMSDNSPAYNNYMDNGNSSNMFKNGRSSWG